MHYISLRNIIETGASSAANVRHTCALILALEKTCREARYWTAILHLFYIQALKVNKKKKILTMNLDSSFKSTFEIPET